MGDPCKNSLQTKSGISVEALDYWRLAEEMTIVDAALLVAGCDPGSEAANVERWEVQDRPIGYEAAKRAILNALRSKAIDGQVRPDVEFTSHGDEYEVPGSVSIYSLINVESLREWLQRRGFSTGFFFPNGVGSAEYLNPSHPRYAPKLAAAVRAWQAVTDPRGRHPKQALSKWLREHAADFSLSDEDGKPNETGIDEAAKVANWQPGGGAPKTPGS